MIRLGSISFPSMIGQFSRENTIIKKFIRVTSSAAVGNVTNSGVNNGFIQVPEFHGAALTLADLVSKEKAKISDRSSFAFTPGFPTFDSNLEQIRRNTKQKIRQIKTWSPSPLFLSRNLDTWKIQIIEETPCDLIDSEDKFKSMMYELKQLQVIELAFDVKHSFSSYDRLTCLITISSRFKDYVIDCVSINDSVRELKEIFENPYVLKVAHCNRSLDVQCLLNDYSIHVVGLFDTSRAEKVIRNETFYQSKSSSYLIKQYFGIATTGNTRSWKLRPLPANNIDAARRESHFLLNVYDTQKKILTELGPTYLSKVYSSSSNICLSGFSSKVRKDWIGTYRPYLSVQQLHALQELNKWRSDTAVIRNRNIRSVAANKTLVRLATTLPTTIEEISAVICEESSSPCTLTENELNDLLKIFQDSRLSRNSDTEETR